MTIVVAFLCTDGVVVAADSMLTPSLGSIQVGHHKGKKVEVLSGNQIFAFAGDQGLGARFKFIADSAAPLIQQFTTPIDYGVILSKHVIDQFTQTGINHNINVNTILGFPHNNKFECCVFEGPIQPRLLDSHHYYVALGSGKISADPFLRFLVDTFCHNQRPCIKDALFLSVWAVQHVIETNPGGVAGPIRIAKLMRNGTEIECLELSDAEVDEHKQAMESAITALRDWKDNLYTNHQGDNMPPMPPDAPAQ